MPYKELRKLYYGSEEEYKRIYEERYNASSTIHMDFIVSKHDCFFTQDNEVIKLMSDILKLDKQIALLRKEMPGVALGQYSRKCLIDEIVLTNNIEGVHSSRKEIGNALAILEDQSEKKGHKNRFLGMVNRYVKLMNYEEVKIDSCQDIRNIYDEIVLEEVLLEDKNNAPDGKIFRKEQTTIRSAADKPIHAGITPERRIIECMDKALSFLHDESIEKLYRICLFHYLLEYIHPFYDGNGRLGRFILSYCISETLESILAYRISETIKENIKWYNNSFEICNDQKNMGDLTPFLIMMFTMIKTSEEELIASLSRKQVSWDRYQKKIQEYCPDAVKKKGNFYNLLIQAALFSELGITMEELTENLKLSEGTVRKYINSAKEKDLIITHRESRQFYYMLNTDVLDLE